MGCILIFGINLWEHFKEDEIKIQFKIIISGELLNKKRITNVKKELTYFFIKKPINLEFQDDGF
jgi:hypothetical protein